MQPLAATIDEANGRPRGMYINALRRSLRNAAERSRIEARTGRSSTATRTRLPVNGGGVCRCWPGGEGQLAMERRCRRRSCAGLVSHALPNRCRLTSDGDLANLQDLDHQVEHSEFQQVAN